MDLNVRAVPRRHTGADVGGVAHSGASWIKTFEDCMVYSGVLLTRNINTETRRNSVVLYAILYSM